MKAKEFNRRYPVGTKFMHIPEPVLRGGAGWSAPLNPREILNAAVLWKSMLSLIS